MAKKRNKQKPTKTDAQKPVNKTEVVETKKPVAVIDARVNVRTLSGFIGVTEQRVTQLCQQGKIPRAEDKSVDLREGIHAYIEILRNQNTSEITDDDNGLTFKNYSERDNYYKSEERRINLMCKSGALVHQTEVQEMFYKIVELTREAFLILPDVLEREADLDRKQIGKVQKYADKKLMSLSNTFKKMSKTK